ncbi:MAG: hypothetical protein M1475_04530 [Actinobacteria bacterium]|nr:hypothetical protein [Actinomycetota bacterium]
MKEEYKELREDVLDEEKAIKETLERLSNARSKFDSKVKDYLLIDNIEALWIDIKKATSDFWDKL